MFSVRVEMIGLILRRVIRDQRIVISKRKAKRGTLYCFLESVEAHDGEGDRGNFVGLKSECSMRESAQRTDMR